MKSIYASKLYRSSSRKATISAALANSANVGLVQQVADSLDEQYRIEELLNPAQEQEAQSQGSEGGQESEGQSSKGSPSGGHSSFPSSLSSGMDMSSFDPEEDLVEYPEGEDFAEEAEAEGTEGEEDSEDETSPGANDVEEATKVEACTCINESEISVLKNGLNSIEGLAGVNRIVVKDKELWIYYNDDTNLNNIMTDVIDYIAKVLPSVEFNRLARSDNAIVFELVEVSTS